MVKKCAWTLAVASCSLVAASADTLELKDKAALTGKILTEKRDQVALDVGYTVLVVPRSQIAKIIRSDVPDRAAKPAAVVKAIAPEATKPETGSQFYTESKRLVPASTVRDLVNIVGEAVVQIRTPSSLG
ncbi:MAG TPA: hypothetical protein VJA21_23515, partial [Verrucomicrobiae bacterium]